MKKTTGQFIEEANRVHGNKYDYSKVLYINALTKVEIKCPDHGSFLQRPISHTRGHGCSICSHINNEILIKKSKEDFIKESNKKHNNKYDYSKVEYKNINTKVEIICKIHGSFWQTPYSHASGQHCPKCAVINRALVKTKPKEDFIKESNKKHNNKYDYSKVEYKNINTKVEIICPEHGPFWQRPCSHKRGQGCPKCGGSCKSNTEEFIEKANSKHTNKYDYSKVEYTGAHTKIEIICPEHGPFLQDPHSHLKGNGCIKCTRLYNPTTEEWILKASKVHNNKYDYSNVEYINNSTKVEIICPEHGSFFVAPGSHTNSKVGCSKCSGKYSPTTEEFIEKANSKHTNKYDYSKVKYVNVNTDIEIICPEHGSFMQGAGSHLCGCGCPKCGGSCKSNTEEFIEKANSKHNNKYNYSKVEYINANTKVEIICPEHGSFLQNPRDHLHGSGCQKCSKKGFSQKAIKWLESIMDKENIHIEHAMNSGEYRIPDTRLRADGYCPENNTVYEFHGTVFHGDSRVCDPEDCNYLGKNYKDLYDKTMEKEKIIKDLGYNLVTMWEYDYDNLNNQ